MLLKSLMVLYNLYIWHGFMNSIYHSNDIDEYWKMIHAASSLLADNLVLYPPLLIEEVCLIIHFSYIAVYRQYGIIENIYIYIYIYI